MKIAVDTSIRKYNVNTNKIRYTQTSTLYHKAIQLNHLKKDCFTVLCELSDHFIHRGHVCVSFLKCYQRTTCPHNRMPPSITFTFINSGISSGTRVSKKLYRNIDTPTEYKENTNSNIL